MKTKKLLFAGLAGLLFASCAQDDSTYEEHNAKQTDITVNADDFVSDGASRSARVSGKKKTALQLGSSGLAFSWTQGDVTGVFAENSGQQMPMKMIDCQGTGNKAYFEREDYELKSGVRYVGYYPVVDRLMQEPFIDIDYEGQVQSTNGSYSHLAKYDYLVSDAVTVEKTNTADFYFNHQGAILRLMIDMPETDTYSSVTLSSADAVFTTKAVMDLFNTTEVIQPKTKSKSVTLDFAANSVSTTADKMQLEAWIMISPADFTTRDMTVTVKSATGKEDVVYTVRPEKNFVKGKAYIINVKNDESDEWVDLGLPSGTLWARKNVGAEKETDYGNYHSWGDSKIITSNKYNDYSGFWIYTNIGKYIDYQGNTRYDIAKALWGGDWVTPNQNDFLELIEYCKTLEWKNIGGVNGLFITGHNGRSIFLPANGDRYVDGYYAVNEVCAYWSSEFKARYNGEDNVGALFTASEDEYPTDLIDWEFAYGCAIRPVIKK